MTKSRRLILIASLAAAGIAAFGIWDTVTPTEIDWETVDLQGYEAWRAPGLILHEERGDALWASRGLSIYRSEAGGRFIKVHTVFPKPGMVWGGFSSTLRVLSRHQELVEVVPVSRHELIVFAGGEIRLIDVSTGESHPTHSMRYYGRGIGRGVMPHGIAVDDLGWVYYGEYVTRRLGSEETVRIYRSEDKGHTWDVVYEFAPFEVRHIHAVRWDPYEQKLWVATGDTDSQSRVGYSTDRGRSFTFIGQGTQEFRACSLIFTKDAVTWIMDSMDSGRGAHTVTWLRNERRVVALDDVFPSQGYYMQALGADRALATVGEKTVGVYLLEPGAKANKLLSWPVDFDPSRPNPVVRLPRSPGSTDWVYVNPLCTRSEAAAIYRLRRPLRAPSS